MDEAESSSELALLPHQPHCPPWSECLLCPSYSYPAYNPLSIHGDMSLPEFWAINENTSFSHPAVAATDSLASPGAQWWISAPADPVSPPVLAVSSSPGTQYVGSSNYHQQCESQRRWQQPLQTMVMDPSQATALSPVSTRLANPAGSSTVAYFSPALPNQNHTAYGNAAGCYSNYVGFLPPLQPSSASDLNLSSFSQDIFDQDWSFSSQYTSSDGQTPQGTSAQDASKFVSSVDMVHMPYDTTESDYGIDLGVTSLSSSLVQSAQKLAADDVLNPRFGASQSSCSPESKKSTRTRGKPRPKSAAARWKAQQVRKMGQCALCKTLQNGCTPDDPCNRCIDTAQKLLDAAERCDAVAPASRLCFRDDESASKARQKILDFSELQARNIFPPTSCDKCPPKIVEIKLIHPPQVRGNKVYHFRNDPLTLHVEGCISMMDVLCISGISTWSTASASTPEELIESSKDILQAKFGADLMANLKSEEGDKSIHSGLCLMQKMAQNYQIRPSSLPTTKQLIEWGSLEIYEKARLFPTDVESVLDAILVQYLKGKPPVALTSLVERILSMTILGQYLDGRRPIVQAKFEYFKSKGLDDRLFRASGMPNEIRSQLFRQAVEGIEEFEKLVLAEIDCLLPANRRAKANISNPLILGLCVRRLALHYRGIMMRYKTFGGEQETRRKNAQDMYDTMTRHYGRVFKGTLSPFHDDWQTANQKDALLGDEVLVAQFEQFKNAEAHHYNHDLNRNDDIIYLAMFAEKKNKKHSYIARNWGKG